MADAILTPTREPSLLSSQVQQGPGHPQDKTNFDDSRVTGIKKGETTEAQVVAMFGPPGGKYTYPMIKERGKTAFVYQYLRMDRNVWSGGVKQSANKRLQITFDATGKVDDVIFSAMERN